MRRRRSSVGALHASCARETPHPALWMWHVPGDGSRCRNIRLEHQGGTVRSCVDVCTFSVQGGPTGLHGAFSFSEQVPDRYARLGLKVEALWASLDLCFLDRGSCGAFTRRPELWREDKAFFCDRIHGPRQRHSAARMPAVRSATARFTLLGRPGDSLSLSLAPTLSYWVREIEIQALGLRVVVRTRARGVPSLDPLPWTRAA